MIDINDLIKLNTAKLAKVLGFNIPCHYYFLTKNIPYVKRGLKSVKGDDILDHNSYDDFIISAPEQKILHDWLLEEYGVILEINETEYSDIECSLFSFVVTAEGSQIGSGGYISYNEAMEAALINAMIRIKSTWKKEE